MSDEDIETVLASIEDKEVKTAIGPGGSLGPSWYEAGPSYNPYFSPGKNPSGGNPLRTAPYYGGETRDTSYKDTLPHGPDPMSNKQPKTKMFPSSGNFPEGLELKKVKRPLDEFEWEIKYELDHWDDPEELKKMVSKMGGAVEFSDRHVSVIVDAYEDATSIQKTWPRSTVQRRSRQ
jgi:hypothetical protein